MAQRASLQARFGERVRVLRKGQRLTQQQLAARCGMDWKNLGSIERGERNVTLGIVERLARGLGVESGQFFMFHERGVVPPEKVTMGWLAERLRACDPETRQLVSSIAALVLELAAKERRK